MACNGCKKKTIIETKITSEEVFSSIFKMRKETGVFQINFGSGLFISSENTTDELAILFLKENPNRISLFETYPKNWKELISGQPTINKADEAIEVTKSK